MAGWWQVVADFRKKLPRWNPSIYAAFSKVWQMWQLFLTPKDFLKISKSKINFKKTATAATVSKKFSIYAGLSVTGFILKLSPTCHIKERENNNE